MGEPINTTHGAAAPTLLDLAPPLLPTEQVGPKGWIRTMLLFRLADDYDQAAIHTVLQTAFSSFKARVPVAGCEAVPLPDPSGKQAGRLQLRRYADDEIEDFVAKDLRPDPGVPSFAELARRGFPPAAFPVDTFCLRGRTGEWPKPGDRMNVVMVQANYVRGGLVLCTLIMHAYADGTTAYKFTQLLAEDVRRAQGLAVDAPAEIPVADRAKLMQAYADKNRHRTLGQPQDHPEYVELPFTPTGLPPKLLAADHVGHVFRFTPAKIAALKALCAPPNTTPLTRTPGAPDMAFLSTNDVVTALVWRCVQAAQHPNVVAGTLTAEDTATPSIIGVALDARRRASVPVHKHTLGNILGFAPAVLPLPALVRDASLADVAVVVRRAVAAADPGAGYLDSITTWVDRLVDMNRLTPTMFLDMPGHHMLMSSWGEFPFYDIQWGPAFGDVLQAVRVPAAGVCHSFQIRLPDNPAKPGVEMFVCGFADDMERLLADRLWTEFAGKPVDN